MKNKQTVVSLSFLKKINTTIPPSFPDSPGTCGAVYIFLTFNMPDYYYIVLGIINKTIDEKKNGALSLFHSVSEIYEIDNIETRAVGDIEFIRQVAVSNNKNFIEYKTISGLNKETLFVDAHLGDDRLARSPLTGNSLIADDRLQIESATEALENFKYENRLINEISFSLINSDMGISYLYGDDVNFIGRDCAVGHSTEKGYHAVSLIGRVSESELTYELIDLTISDKIDMDDPSPITGERNWVFPAIELEELLGKETVRGQPIAVKYTIPDGSTIGEAVDLLLNGMQGYLFTDKNGNTTVTSQHYSSSDIGDILTIRADDKISIKKDKKKYATKIILTFPDGEVKESSSEEAAAIFGNEKIKEITTSIIYSDEDRQDMADRLLALYSTYGRIIEVTTTDDLSNISLLDFVYIEPTLNDFSFGANIYGRVYEIDRVQNTLTVIEEPS